MGKYPFTLVKKGVVGKTNAYIEASKLRNNGDFVTYTEERNGTFSLWKRT
jgi:hypothetical protein